MYVVQKCLWLLQLTQNGLNQHQGPPWLQGKKKRSPRKFEIIATLCSNLSLALIRPSFNRRDAYGLCMIIRNLQQQYTLNKHRKSLGPEKMLRPSNKSKVGIIRLPLELIPVFEFQRGLGNKTRPTSWQNYLGLKFVTTQEFDPHGPLNQLLSSSKCKLNTSHLIHNLSKKNDDSSEVIIGFWNVVVDALAPFNNSQFFQYWTRLNKIVGLLQNKKFNALAPYMIFEFSAH